MRLLGIAVLTTVLLLATPAVAQAHIEDYASYTPPSKCHEKPRAGTAYLAHWVVRKFGSSLAGMSRPCKRRATSEHQNGRAFDWSLDARKRSDRELAHEFMDRIFATDAHGNTDAWARRMGVMYLIWNDRMFPAWNGFEPEPYLSSSCKTKKKCSPTLRHRDHVHVSLSRDGARGLTSWYNDRI
jgi:hypothetical protein